MLFYKDETIIKRLNNLSKPSQRKVSYLDHFFGHSSSHFAPNSIIDVIWVLSLHFDELKWFH